MTKRIEILIIKYFSDSLSDHESQELLSWIETGKNKKKFNDYISLNHAIEVLKSENQDDSLLWMHIQSSIKRPVRKLNYWKYAVAASVLLLVALTVFINKNNKPQFIEPIIVHNNIETGTDKATLTLEDGTNVTLENGQQYISDKLESNGKKIIYKSTNTSRQEIAYNYLTIPRGGQYHLELSDGTEVWLNSETQLKYPVAFNDGKPRQVELIYGEAYFDVSPSTEHEGAKFEVFNKHQEIEVIGTEFNIKAYKDETNIFTTLVEGKVTVSIDNSDQSLKPNQQLNLDLNTNRTIIKEVDVYGEISWKDGVFSFEEKPLKEIMKVLSRWYDVEVVFENEEIENEEFIGLLRKDQKIEEILSKIKDSGIIKEYEFKDKILVLK